MEFFIGFLAGIFVMLVGRAMQLKQERLDRLAGLDYTYHG